jgi:hypothetical protein
MKTERVEPGMKVKFPPDLKVWLKQRAAKNLRSMNNEVVAAVMAERERIERAENATGKRT